MKKRGTLLVLSGPSGSGKGTLVKEYTDKNDNVFVSISATTRNPREGERYGINYYYMTEDEFKAKIEEGGFLEYALFCDHYYGTPKAQVFEKLERGEDVILEIDVQGALQVKENCPEAVLVFTAPPSYAVLKERLINRGTESENVIKQRLSMAAGEFEQAHKYDYIIINDCIDDAVDELEAIFKAEKCKSAVNMDFVREFKEGVSDNVIS